jgi:hypothetical protein
MALAARLSVMELDARRSIEDLDELKRTVPILVATILLFFAHQALNLEPATVAMTGATAMLFVSRQPLERSLAGIEGRSRLAPASAATGRSSPPPRTSPRRAWRPAPAGRSDSSPS